MYCFVKSYSSIFCNENSLKLLLGLSFAVFILFKYIVGASLKYVGGSCRYEMHFSP